MSGLFLIVSGLFVFKVQIKFELDVLVIIFGLRLGILNVSDLFLDLLFGELSALAFQFSLLLSDVVPSLG